MRSLMKLVLVVSALGIMFMTVRPKTTEETVMTIIVIGFVALLFLFIYVATRIHYWIFGTAMNKIAIINDEAKKRKIGVADKWFMK